MSVLALCSFVGRESVVLIARRGSVRLVERGRTRGTGKERYPFEETLLRFDPTLRGCSQHAEESGAYGSS